MKRALFILIVPAIWLVVSCLTPAKVPDSSSSDIEALLARMSIEEKAGQMTQINLDVVCVGGIYNLEEPHRLDAAKLRTALVEWKVGSVLNCGGHAYPRSQWLELVNGIQQVAVAETRLKIPVVYGIDAIHGANYVMESTLFPQQLAMAATFDTVLARKGAEITAYETRAAGIPWNFSPVLDVGRMPLWSRFFETYGEDPTVCAAFGKATVRGYQGDGKQIDRNHVAACMKHFVGYSAARTGRDRTPSYIPDIQLHDVYLPPFKEAVNAGALTVMINSGEVNGVPVHASNRMLTDLLRNTLKFSGVAVTDWEDVIKLRDNHKVAHDLKEAVKMAVDAGIDMCMVPNDFEFTRLLIELVKEGKIAEKRLDVSVRRILQLKKDLGLLEGWKPVTIADYPRFASDEFARTATEAAKASITLLSNPMDALPLTNSKKVLVTGPAAHSLTMLNGAWTRTWQGTDSKYDSKTRTTILTAMKQRLGSGCVYAEGCSIDSLRNVQETLALAASADVIVACMGERPSTEKPGDINDLNLPKAQIDFVQQLIATGKPVVLVLVENRPLLVNDIADRCAAVVMAYQPGDFGGEAVAAVLLGEHNPGGRLPFTYPRYNHSLLLYDHKYTETVDPQFGNKAFQPQWEFGHGLHYGEVTCTNFSLSADKVSTLDNIKVSATLTNKGNKAVKHSSLLFVRDDVATITPAAKRLKRFAVNELAPGESREISFVLHKEDFTFLGENLQPTLEPGTFTLILDGQSTIIEYRP